MPRHFPVVCTGGINRKSIPLPPAFAAERFQNGNHIVHIGNARTIQNRHVVICQKCRCQNGQHRIFGRSYARRSAYPPASNNAIYIQSSHLQYLQPTIILCRSKYWREQVQAVKFRTLMQYFLQHLKERQQHTSQWIRWFLLPKKRAAEAPSWA